MLRITSLQRERTTEIKLEGKLVGPWVAECRALCARESACGQHLALDLGELRFADREGVELLHELAAAGHVERSSGFVAELLRGDNGDKGDGMNGNSGIGQGSPAAGRARTATLLARLREQQMDAFEELLRRYGGEMLATAQRCLPDARESREALVRSYQIACTRVRECAREADLGAWLQRIVMDVCSARMSAERDGAAIEELLPRFDAGGAHAHPIAPWESSTGSRAELLAEVRRRIAELPPSYRLVVLLADHEGLAPREIAERLGIPRAEVEARLHRARQALVTLLDPARASRAAG